MSAEEHEPVVIRDNRKIDPLTGAVRKQPTAGGADASSAPAGAAAAAEDDVPKAEALLLEERTRDLQRVQAEYANYRKRADRERLAAGELAVGRTLTELLPIVDDLDRAKAHGDLTGGLKAVADKLDAIFANLGLQAFGEVGDPFDPAIHEAVLHDESDAVSEPTCTTVMRPGFRHHDRLLRPAMVGVTDPVSPAAPVPAESAPDAGVGKHREEQEDGSHAEPASDPTDSRTP